ncbi:MAG: hypothetical protein ABI977_24905 [Acidobacteriota bacterium]
MTFDEFEIVGSISNVEVIARGHGIRQLTELQREFGGKNWRKVKGEAIVKLRDGKFYRADLHWYEAHGVGKQKVKIKRLLD